MTNVFAPSSPNPMPAGTWTAIIAGNPAADSTPPTVFLPQRYPWNPGGTNFGVQYGYKQIVATNSDFWVWTYAYDVSGITNVSLLVRNQRHQSAGERPVQNLCRRSADGRMADLEHGSAGDTAGQRLHAANTLRITITQGSPVSRTPLWIITSAPLTPTATRAIRPSNTSGWAPARAAERGWRRLYECLRRSRLCLAIPAGSSRFRHDFLQHERQSDRHGQPGQDPSGLEQLGNRRVARSGDDVQHCLQSVAVHDQCSGQCH